MHTARLRASALSGLIASVLLFTTACKKKEAAPSASGDASTAPAAQAPIPPPPLPLAVAGVEMGKAITPDNKVANATTVFGTSDTIYAVVNTTGAGTNATLQAKWSYVKAAGGETAVNESSITISPTGPLASEFHITKKSAWPRGKYKVEVSLNGASAGTTEFEVK